MSVEHPNRHAADPSGARRSTSAMGAAAARSRRLVRSSVVGLTVVALGGGAVSVATAPAAQAVPQQGCSAALSTGTDKTVLLHLPATGDTGADSYDGGYQAPAKASEWTNYSLEGDATTANTLAVSFRQNSNNGPSLHLTADQNTLRPLRLNNGGWSADGTLALPAGTLTPDEPFHFKIAVLGQQVTVQIDGVQVAQFSRPWIPSSGTIGIRVTGSDTGTLDNLIVRQRDTDKYLYADDFESWTTGTAGGTAAGYSGLEIVDGCLEPVDRGALGRALLAQSALAADDYTTSSWAALMAVVDGAAGAQAVHGGSGFSQEQVDAATAAVNAGVAALLERGDPTSLESLLMGTRGLLDDLDGYTEASANALRDAAAVAETVYAARADKTDAQLQAATSALQSAVDGLTAQPDQVEKAALKHLYDQGAAMSNAAGAFTPASWATLQRELAEAGAVLADDAATQAHVDQAAAELAAALTALVPVQVAPPEPTVSRVKLNQAQLRLVRGKSVRLEEAVYFTSGPAAYVGAAVWKSSNPKIATVSSTGSIKARKTGKVTITVTSVKPGASGKLVSTRIQVQVVKSRSTAKVKKVRATVPKTMKVGQSAFLTGSYSPATATGVKVTYRSSASGVAQVDVAGRVVARKKGTVKITVKAGGASRTYKVTVR